MKILIKNDSMTYSVVSTLNTKDGELKQKCSSNRGKDCFHWQCQLWNSYLVNSHSRSGCNSWVGRQDRTCWQGWPDSQRHKPHLELVRSVKPQAPPERTHQNMHCNKVPRWLTCTRMLDRHWAGRRHLQLHPPLPFALKTLQPLKT